MKNICVKGILILLLCLTQFVVFAQTPSVGGTNMSVDVSPMGSASATIPIFCPPGRMGMQPQVAITYNSSAGDGLLGKNISLSGTSAITRSGNNYHLNGYQEGVQLDNNNDNFELDGMRLIWVGGAPRGTNGSIYRTEEEQFSKITFSGNDFKVELKDGGVLFYGQGGNSKLVSSGATALHATAYYLYRRYDIDGNYIEYNYQMPGGQIQLTEIKYTGFDCTLFNTRSCSTYPASLPYNKVVFTYMAAAAVNKVWVKGTSLQTDKMLEKVEVFEGANKVREYVLSYSNNGLSYYLASVQEKNGAGESFEPIFFNWKDDFATAVITQTVPTTNYDDFSCSGDFNGDGKSDVFIVNGPLSLTQSGFLLSTNHIYKVYSINPGTKKIDNILLNTGLLCNNGTDAMDITQILVGDLNQDGLDDILCQTIGYNWTNSSHMILDVRYHAMIAKIDGSGKLQFNVERNYFAGYTNNNYTQHNIIGVPALRFTSYLGDCDGDGLTDLIEIAKDQTSASNFLFHNVFITYGKNKGAKYHLAGYNAYLQNFSNAFITDFDGNGKTDITLVFETFTDVIKATASDASWGYLYHSGGFPTSVHKGLQTGDFNGDAKTDLLYYINEAWHVAYSTGNVWDEHNAEQEFGLEHFSDNHYCYDGGLCQAPDAVACQVGDFNGDGKSDIMQRHYHPTLAITGHYADERKIYYSKGYGFAEVSYGANNAPLTYLFSYSKNNLLADFDGDGKTDIFTRQYGPGQISNGRLSITLEYFADRSKHLNYIKPTQHSQYSFKFKPLPQSAHFRKSNILSFDQTLAVVPKIWIAEEYSYNVTGTDIAKTYKYYYDQLVFHRLGRGIMGFMKTAVVDVHSNPEKSIAIVTENTQNLEHRYKLDPHFVRTYKNPTILSNFVGVGSNSVLLTQREMATFSVPVVSNFGASSTTAVTATHFTYISYITETDFVKQVKKRTCFRYDINGNLDFSRTDYYQVANYNNIEHSSTSFNQYEQKGSWLPSLVTKTQTTLIRNGAPQTHTDQTDITNNIRNKPTRIQKFVNNPSLYVSKELFYDGYGNITQKKIDYTANTTGNSIVTDAYTYSNNGRFLSTSKNVLNQTTTYTFESVYGNKLTVTGANGLVSRYSYDSWGRLSQTTASNGNTTTVLRSWNTVALPTFVSTIMPRFYVHTYNNLGEKSTEYYDNAGRQIATKTTGFGTANNYTDIVYDAENRVSKKSNVYASASDKLYSETVYDLYNRPSQQKYNNILMASYAYDKTAVAVTTKIEGQDVTKTTTTYATGHTSKVQDAGGEIVYNLGAHNLPLSIVTSGNTTSIQYNAALQQTQLCDPNAGCYNYEYDALGQLTKQTDATNNIYTMQYDIAGRLIKKKGGANEEYAYQFYGTVGQASLNQLQTEELKIGGVSSHAINYTYGVKGELLTTTEVSAGKFTNKVTRYTYDNMNRVSTITYPNVKTVNKYDATNNHVSINLIEKNGSTVNIMLWNKKAELADGRTSQFELGNGFIHTYTYDGNQQLSTIYSAKATVANANDVAIHTNYTFELQSGNLTQRSDKVIPSILGLEKFYYDNMDRLVSIQQVYKSTSGLAAPYLSGSAGSTYAIAYASNGNITGKYDAGIYTYDASKPHAVQTNEYQVGMLAPRITPPHFAEEQQLTYTAFNKVATISQLGALGTNKPVAIAFDYGVSEQRIKMEITENNVVTNTTYYINSANMELVNGDEVTYLYAEGKPIAMHRKSDNVIYYLHVDYQGSLMAISNEAGTLVERRSYDAWGRPRRIDNLEYNLASPFGGSNSSFTLRGYTFHEHLEMVGLINMNGRMYDPVLGRILSPDNFVQAPGNTQSFNRYSYCLNNPTKYTDPSGDFFIYGSIGYSQGGGFDISVTAGIGVPGLLSAQTTVGYNTKSQNIYGTVGVSAYFVTASVTAGTKSGVSAGLSVGIPGMGIPLGGGFGANSNMISAGVNYSFKSQSWSGNAFGHNIDAKGRVTFDPSIGLSYSIYNSKSKPSTALASPTDYSDDRSITCTTCEDGLGLEGAKEFPSFSKLWSNYPPDNADGTHAHPSRDDYQNQCAIRLGFALQKSGVDFSKYQTGPLTSEGYPRGARSLADWIWTNYGKPEIMSQINFEKQHMNSTGIIFINQNDTYHSPHIDLFKQGQTGSGYYQGSEIWFWQVK